MQLKQENFFLGYNRIMSLVYGAIIISAILLFSFLYNDNNQAIVQSINLRLFEQRQSFNSLMHTHYDAVKSLQRQARTFINQPFKRIDPDIELIAVPNQNKFYLNVDPDNYDSYVSISGIGNIELISDLTWQEINMGFRLNSLMGVLKNTSVDINTLHYTSKKEFKVSYPYEKINDNNFSLEIYDQEFYQRSLPKNNREDKLFWTDLYMDPFKKVLMIIGAAPVYGGTDFKGTVSINFFMNSLHKFFDDISYRFGELYVLNEFNTVIGDSTKRKDKETVAKKLVDVLPRDLDLQEILNLEASSLKRIGHYWVFITHTDFAPWKMIYCCRNSDLIFFTLRHILPGLILALVITTIFLIFADRLIAREFIEPANILVKHIIQHGEHSTEDIKNTKEPWRTWFIAIKDVFDRNRELVEKLESDILHLDEKVALRTKDLFKKNKQVEKTLDDLKTAQNQIITQEKLAGLGALTAGIAHEIRNPLNFILNFTETSKSFCEELLKSFKPLLKNLTPDQQQNIRELADELLQNMNRIKDHGLRADSIVRGMLSHARGQEDVIKETDINTLLQENLTLALASYSSHGFVPEIIANYNLNIPEIKLFAQDIGRVFLNIFNNACYALYEKYQNQEGGLGSPIIRIATHCDNDNVYVTIEDNGPGMPKNVRQKIFNPFFTTKPTGQGTGLGLSLSYEIVVNQHQGKLDVDSKIGESTLFKISLPIH